MVLTLRVEFVFLFVITAILLGWFVAWRQVIRRERAEKRREAQRELEFQRLIEEARRPLRVASLEPVEHIRQERLTEEQRQRIHRVFNEVSRDMGTFNREFEASMRRSFEPFDRVMRDLDRQIQRMPGVTVTRTVTEHKVAPKEEPKPETPAPSRFDRILKDD